MNRIRKNSTVEVSPIIYRYMRYCIPHLSFEWTAAAMKDDNFLDSLFYFKKLRPRDREELRQIIKKNFFPGKNDLTPQ